MELSEVPDSEPIGIVDSERGLAELFRHVMGSPQFPFQHLDLIKGSLRSGRVLFQEVIKPYTLTVPLNPPRDATQMAFEFFRPHLLNEIRIPNPETPTSTMRKGWEVRIARPEGKLMIILWATWVDTH